MRSTSSPSCTTSWHAAVVTLRGTALASAGRRPAISASSRALFGARVWTSCSMVRACSSRSATPSARDIRLREPYALMRRGTLRALHVLEEEGGPSTLHGAVGDLGELEIRIDLTGHPDELALALERLHECSQPVVRHGSVLPRTFKYF